MREQRLEVAIGGDQVLRTFLTDAGDALDVVDRVPHQRDDVDNLRGLDTEPLFDAGRVVPRTVFFWVVDLDAVVNELEEVLVPGHDRHVEASLSRLRRQRPDHVVGLEAP